MTNPSSFNPSVRYIRSFLRQTIYGSNMKCPECFSYRVVTYGKRYRCRECCNRFSFLSCTWLSWSKLSLPDLWKVLWCFVHAIPIKQAQQMTHLSEKAIRHWYDACRDQLIRIDTKLKGKIQVDEVYLGGWGGRVVIAGKSLDTKEVRFHICMGDRPTQIDSYLFFYKYITEHSYIFTDSSPIYPKVCKHFSCFHHQDTHAQFEFSKTSQIEGLFGNLRTFVRRTYHHITLLKLPEYLVEFQYRFSRKKYFTSVEQFLLFTISSVTSG